LAVALGSAGCGAILDFEDNYYVIAPEEVDPCAGRCPVSPDRVKGPKLADMLEMGADGPSEDYCIDSTEVTVGHYTTFLEDTEASSFLPPGECTEDPSMMLLVPVEVEQPGEGNDPMEVPITYVSWCAAYAYCSWAGKRLCGSMGGGPSDFTDPASDQSQWRAACSWRGTFPYPYGATFNETTCNLTGDPEEVGKTPGCTGQTAPYSCVRDLSGNAREWEDACSATTPTKCLARGGDWDENSVGAECDGLYTPTLLPQSILRGVGFRCCYDLPNPG